jgi:hypothetical protein
MSADDAEREIPRTCTKESKLLESRCRLRAKNLPHTDLAYEQMMRSENEIAGLKETQFDILMLWL